IAVPDTASKGIDLDEMIGTEFDIAANAVHPDGLLLQSPGNIGYFDIGEPENGVVPQLGFRAQPDTGGNFLLEVLGDIMISRTAKQIVHGQAFRFQIESDQRFSFLHLRKPQGVVVDPAAEADVAAVQLTAEVAQ